jgi:hypothetical protein
MTAPPIADVAREFCEQQGWRVNPQNTCFYAPIKPIVPWRALEWLATYEGMELVLETAGGDWWPLLIAAATDFDGDRSELPAAVLRAAVEAGR